MNNSEFLIPLCISIISLVLSVVQFIHSYSDSKKQLESHFFSILFTDLLTKDIPLARDQIRITPDNNVVGTDDIIDSIYKLRKNCVMYKAIDIKFFERVTQLCTEIEDDYVLIISVSTRENLKKFQSIDSKIMKLYKLLMKKYSG